MHLFFKISCLVGYLFPLRNFNIRFTMTRILLAYLIYILQIYVLKKNVNVTAVTMHIIETKQHNHNTKFRITLNDPYYYKYNFFFKSGYLRLIPSRYQFVLKFHLHLRLPDKPSKTSMWSQYMFLSPVKIILISIGTYRLNFFNMQNPLIFFNFSQSLLGSNAQGSFAM